MHFFLEKLQTFVREELKPNALDEVILLIIHTTVKET